MENNTIPTTAEVATIKEDNARQAEGIQLQKAAHAARGIWQNLKANGKPKDDVSKALKAFNAAKKELDIFMGFEEAPAPKAATVKAAIAWAMAETGKSFLKVWNSEKDSLRSIVGEDALTPEMWAKISPATIKEAGIVIPELKSGGYSATSVRKGLLSLLFTKDKDGKMNFPGTFTEAAVRVIGEKNRAALALAEKKAQAQIAA